MAPTAPPKPPTDISTDHEPSGISAEPTRSSLVTITHQMVTFNSNLDTRYSLPSQLLQAIAEVLEHLGHHGCNDVTAQLDLSKSSKYPLSQGGFGDVYRGALRDGSLVSLKCLRLRMDVTEIAKKQLKASGFHTARKPI
jgi:hypothetical protein